MNTPQRHQRVYELFVQARDLPEGRRRALLQEACADDPELRAEVEAFLKGNRGLDGFMEQAPPVATRAASGIETHTSDPSSGHRAVDAIPPTLNIAGYEIVRELHRGGQGVVYQALQKATKRKVAIKVLREGPFASRAALKRFEREVELVAQLKHPNIIAIFDSGTTPQGWRYCAMDYVRGVPLTRYVRDHQLTLEDTLKIFSAVCSGVQYAHYKGVIHRDLKPSNILVDSDGNPKILDFGLARQFIGPVDTVVSMTQEVVGTLPYMSPEQARGNPDHIDTRTDIYALGVILYELLTGHFPYPVAGHLADVLQHIAETPPTPPSRQWTPDSGVTQRSGRHLRAGQCPIDDELQTVILKTLAKERDRRYATAADLARDIQHYLLSEPIDAKRDSSWYVFRKSVNRHRRKIAFTALLIVVLGLFQASHRHRQFLEAQRREAAELLSLALQDKELGRWTEAEKKLDQALNLDPDNVRAWSYAAWLKKEDYTLNRAYDFRDPQLLQEAGRYCDQALALEAGRPGLWNLKAAILMGLGDWSGAEQACDQALAIDERYSYAESTLAKVLAVQRRWDEALDMAGRAARHTEDNNDYADDAWRTLATLQLYLDRPEAPASLQEASRINHRDTRIWLLLARLYLTLSDRVDHDEALFAARLADVYRKLDDPRYPRILAQARLHHQLWSDALTSAQEALDGGDEPAYAHFIAAIAAAGLGDLPNAERHFREARAHWPEAFETSDVIVTVEKEFLWLDTREELETLQRSAEQAIASARNRAEPRKQ